MADISTLLQSVIELLDVLVELYLGFFVKQLLRLDHDVRSKLNEILRRVLDDKKKNIPQWLTADFIAYARALMVIPTILLLVWDQLVLSALLVILVDLAGLLNCVVARFWVDAKRDLAEDAVREDDRPISKALASSENENMDIYEFGTSYETSFVCLLSMTPPHVYASRSGNHWFAPTDEILESQPSKSHLLRILGCDLRKILHYRLLDLSSVDRPLGSVSIDPIRLSLVVNIGRDGEWMPSVQVLLRSWRCSSSPSRGRCLFFTFCHRKLNRV